MKFTRVDLDVAAVHLIFLGFFFFKPEVHYFVVICVSSAVVWSSAFALRAPKRFVLPVAFVLQVVLQQAAYQRWMVGQVGVIWPLAQFIALQYIMVLSLSRPDPDR